MSVVTNIMIIGLFDDTESEQIKNHLKKFTDKTMEFMWVDGSKVGGSKCLESDVLIGAFNYMDYDLFYNTIKDMSDFLDDFVYKNV